MWKCYLSPCAPLIPGIDPEVQVPETGAVLCTVLEEQKSRKQNQQLPLSGPELAAMMKIGTVVMRGVDWKWGDQVRPLPSLCLSNCHSISLMVCPSIHLFMCPMVDLSIHPFVYVSNGWSVHTSICLCAQWSNCPSICLFMCPVVGLSIHPSVYVSNGRSVHHLQLV